MTDAGWKIGFGLASVIDRDRMTVLDQLPDDVAPDELRSAHDEDVHNCILWLPFFQRRVFAGPLLCATRPGSPSFARTPGLVIVYL